MIVRQKNDKNWLWLNMLFQVILSQTSVGKGFWGKKLILSGKNDRDWFWDEKMIMIDWVKHVFSSDFESKKC